VNSSFLQSDIMKYFQSFCPWSSEPFWVLSYWTIFSYWATKYTVLYRFQAIKWSSRLLPICSNSTSTRGSREEHLVLQLLRWHLKPGGRFYTCQTAQALFSIQAQSSFKLLFCIKQKIRIKSNRRSAKKIVVLCYVAPWSLV